MVPRRTTATLEQDAVAALSKALDRIGIVTNVLSAKPSAGEMRVEAAGQQFDAELWGSRGCGDEDRQVSGSQGLGFALTFVHAVRCSDTGYRDITI